RRDRLHVRHTADAVCSKNFLLLGHGLIETLERSFVNGKVLIFQAVGVQNVSRYESPLGAAFARFISLIFRWSVRRLMPSFLASAVTLPFVAASAWAINFFSVWCRSSGLVFTPQAS